MKRLIAFLCCPLLLVGQNDPIQWNKRVVVDSLTGLKQVAVANIDRDENRNVDLVLTANPESDGTEDPTQVNVLWLENLGNEIFQSHPIDYRLVGARGLAVGDLNGDGWPEVVAGSRSDTSRLMIYKNDGSPATGDWERFPIGGAAPNHYEILIVDLDQDGKNDIVDGIGDDANFGQVAEGGITDSIRFLKNQSLAETFDFESYLVAQTSSPSAVAVSDFNRDGLLDIAGSSWVDYSSINPVAGEHLSWWARVSDTVFVKEQELVNPYGGNDLQAVDFNNDGAQDLIAAGYKTGTLDLWLNDGNGNFNMQKVVDSNLTHPRHLYVNDIDSDGDPDIALTVDQENKLIWYENKGQLSFTRHVVDSGFSYAYAVCIFDLDGDGDNDLLATAQNSGELAWWENDLAEVKLVNAGFSDTLFFNDQQLKIKFDALNLGAKVSAHFNQGENSPQMEPGIEQVADSGFYTIVTRAGHYQTDLVFYYDSIAQWQNLTQLDESRLQICYWNDTLGVDGMWQLAGNAGQIVDMVNKSITVLDITNELHKYSRFTLCLTSGPSFVQSQHPAQVPVSIEHKAFPNPFNSQIKIALEIPPNNLKDLQTVELNIYNVLGQKIRTIFSGVLPAGPHRFFWNGINEAQNSVSSGWYFYRIKVGKRMVQGKILLVR